MKKALLGAAALGLLSSVAVAEPLKLDDSTLGDVAGGFSLSANTTTNNYSSVTETMSSVMTSTDTRSLIQDLGAMTSNVNYSTGVGSEGVSAVGNASSVVTGSIVQ